MCVDELRFGSFYVLRFRKRQSIIGINYWYVSKNRWPFQIQYYFISYVFTFFTCCPLNTATVVIFLRPQENWTQSEFVLLHIGKRSRAKKMRPNLHSDCIIKSGFVHFLTVEPSRNKTNVLQTFFYPSRISSNPWHSFFL